MAPGQPSESHPNARRGCNPGFDDVVHARLLDEIGRTKTLSAGANAFGVRVHTLPLKPRDIEDDGLSTMVFSARVAQVIPANPVPRQAVIG